MVVLTALPTEIRHMIYQYCNLTVDEEITPYPASDRYDREHQVSRKLDVALIAVNKQIRSEVSPILYGQNTWRFIIGGSEIEVFWIQPLLFRHLVITFDGGDLSKNFMHRTTDHARKKYADTVDPHDYKCAVSSYVHEQSCRRLRIDWTYHFHIIQNMDLVTLTFNIGFSYCPSGCCRLIHELYFHPLFAMGLNMSTQIRITEPDSLEEEHDVLDAIAKARAKSEKALQSS
ncbi:MAG: hypothetical protein Q9216_002780 [Gyalolechia sp. 2 TL-2023]